MKSWMSTRRPACAPPPKIWISGSGISASRRLAEQIAPERLAARRGGGVQRRHRNRDQRVAAEPRLARRAVERDQAPSIAAWSAASMPGQRRGDFAVDRGDRAAARRGRRSACRRRASRPPRPSRSRRRRVRSPGRPRRRRGAPRLRPSGRPRESQTRRPRTAAMRVSLMRSLDPGLPPRPRAPRRAGRPGRAARRARDAPHRGPCRIVA